MASVRNWDKTAGATLYAAWAWEWNGKDVLDIEDEHLVALPITAIAVSRDDLVTLTWNVKRDATVYFVYGRRTLTDGAWSSVHTERAQGVRDDTSTITITLENNSRTDHHFFTLRALVK